MGRRGATQRRASSSSEGGLSHKFRCLLLDCDGVLWLGSEPIEGSAEAVKTLKDAGRMVIFVTNASAPTRATVAARITGQLGIQVDASNVVTSSSAAAEFVASNCPAIDGAVSAFVVGADGLREELRSAGITVVEPVLPDPFDELAFRELAATLPAVSAVVIGHDEAFSYAKLATASVLLQQGGDRCTLVNTNPDVGNRDKAGYLIPEAGSLVAAVEAASGRKATVVGKPSPQVISQLLEKHGLSAEEVLVVGDRLDTDVRFGNSAGARTCLVLTGVATQSEAEALPADEQPTFVRKCLAEVVSSEDECAKSFLMADGIF